MRVRAAQDLVVAGRSILQIMTAGRWTSINVLGAYAPPTSTSGTNLRLEVPDGSTLAVEARSSLDRNNETKVCGAQCRLRTPLLD